MQLNNLIPAIIIFLLYGGVMATWIVRHNNRSVDLPQTTKRKRETRNQPFEEWLTQQEDSNIITYKTYKTLTQIDTEKKRK